MKLRTGRSNQGGVLVMTIVICSLVGMMLAAYLSMVSSQHTFTQRSQVWNNTIPLCEAGVEQAMAHINHISVSTNFEVNGWRRHGTGFTNQGNLNGGTYTMYIDNAWPPIIKVWGTLNEPLGHGSVTRGIEVRTKMNQRFPAAILGRGTINLGGMGRIDSFNSTNALESGPGGQYAESNATARALVATTSRLTPAISVGNMKIYGRVATGVGGTVAVQPAGCVGSLPFHANPANRGSIETGYQTDDANYYIPPATLPNDFGPVTPLLPTPVNVLGTNYKYAIQLDGDYDAANILVGNGEAMLITAKARLLVRGDVLVQGTGYVLLATNASIELYGRGRITLSGGGCINVGGYAINCSLVSLTPLPVTYSGGSRLVGTIYAPQSNVTLTGTTDAIGAITCNNFTLSGGMGIHYDEALKGNPKIRFLAANWTEMNL